MTVFAWIGIATAAVVAVVVLLAAGFALTGALDRRKRRRQRLKAPAQPSQVIPWPVPEGDALALVCGVCNGVPGAFRCACSGNCGSQRCRGGAVAWDMSGELQQITREGNRG